MSIALKKSGKISLRKAAASLKNVMIGLGWDARATDGADFDLDASVVLLNARGRVTSDEDFVFYNNLVSSDGSVEHMGDNRVGLNGSADAEEDAEMIVVKLTEIPEKYDRIVVIVSIYDAEENDFDFGMVDNAYIRIVDLVDGKEITRFDLAEKADGATAMVFGELIRQKDSWDFKAVGEAAEGGFVSLLRGYGLNV